MNLEELLQGYCSLREVESYFGSGHRGDLTRQQNRNEKAFALCAHFGILPSRNAELQCPMCGENLRSYNDKTRSVGFRFKCRTGHAFLPTVNTLFQNVMCNVAGADSFVLGIQCFLLRMSVSQFIAVSGLSKPTATAWYSYYRNVAKKIAWHDLGRIGGAGDVVEVDESQLFRRKYGVGRLTRMNSENVWAFGGISRTTKKVFAVIVPNRRRETLLPIMLEHVDNASYICSDCWRAYRGCDQHFAGHGAVNHQEGFVFPRRQEEPQWVAEGTFNIECLDGKWRGPPPRPDVVPFRCHTQTVERTWRELKRVLSPYTQGDTVDEYIGEWMYRKNNLSQVPNQKGQFFRFMSDIRRAYPGVGLEKMKDDKRTCDCHECA